MENIKFIIKNKKDFIIIMNNNETYGDLRRKINNEIFKEPEQNVLIKAIIDNPIRGFGLMTLNPGNIPFTFDNIRFERFNLLNKNIFIHVELIQKEENKPKKKNKNYYRSPYLNNKEKKQKEFNLDLSDEKDFPSL